MGRVDGHLTVHRLFVHGPDHDPSLVVEDVVVSLDGLLSEQLSCDLTVLTPLVIIVSSIRMKFRGCDVPSLAVRRGSDRTTMEDSLVLHEVLLTTREDRTIVDQELTSDIRVGDDDVELVTQEERVQRAEFLGPGMEGTLRVIGKVG